MEATVRTSQILSHDGGGAPLTLESGAINLNLISQNRYIPQHTPVHASPCPGQAAVYRNPKVAEVS